MAVLMKGSGHTTKPMGRGSSLVQSGTSGTMENGLTIELPARAFTGAHKRGIAVNGSTIFSTERVRNNGLMVRLTQANSSAA